MLKLFFFIISSSSPSLSVQQQDQFKFKRVCYLRPEANFPIDRIIEQNLCTHIIIAFVSIDEQSELSYDQNVADFIRICRQSIDIMALLDNLKLVEIIDRTRLISDVPQPTLPACCPVPNGGHLRPGSLITVYATCPSNQGR